MRTKTGGPSGLPCMLVRVVGQGYWITVTAVPSGAHS